MSLKYHYNLIYNDLKVTVENFSLGNQQSRTALKTALACVTAIIFANAVKLPMPFWSGITTLVMMRPNVGASFSKGWMRTGGCTIGCVLGIFFFGFIVQNSILFSVFIFAGMFLSFYAGVRAENGYFWAYMLANMVLIGLLSFSNPHGNFPIDIAFYRAAEILVGVISSWIFNIILWPNYASEEFDLNFEYLLKKILTFNKELVTQCQKGEKDLDVLDELKTGIDKQLSKCKSLIEFAGTEKKFLRKDAADYKILARTAENRIIQLTNILKIYKSTDISLMPFTFMKFLKRALSYLEKMPDIGLRGKRIFQNYLINPSDINSYLDKKEALSSDVQCGSPTIIFFYSFAYYLELSLRDLIFISHGEFDSKERKVSSTENENSDFMSFKIFSYDFPFYIPSLINATKGGLIVLFIFWFCLWLQIPGGFLNMTVAIVAVMGPQMSAMDTKHKGILRFLGCILGGASGLFFLLFSIDSTFVNFTVIFAVIFIFSYLWGSRSGIAYIGLQSGIAFLLCSAGSFQIVTSIDSVIERLTGIFIAVSMMWITNFIIWPDDFVTRLLKRLDNLRKNIDKYISEAINSTRSEIDFSHECLDKVLLANIADIEVIMQNCMAQNDLPSDKISSIKEWLYKLKNILIMLAGLNNLNGFDGELIELLNKDHPRFFRHMAKIIKFSIYPKNDKARYRVNSILDKETRYVKLLLDGFTLSSEITYSQVKSKTRSVQSLIKLLLLFGSIQTISKINISIDSA